MDSVISRLGLTSWPSIPEGTTLVYSQVSSITTAALITSASFFSLNSITIGVNIKLGNYKTFKGRNKQRNTNNLQYYHNYNELFPKG